MSELNSYKKTVYCGWTKNSEDLCESASGGIFYCLAKKILEEDGYVVGAVYSDDFKSVKHIMSRNIEDIKRMRGSKYSQSNYVDVIDKVEEKCKNGNNVLFSGTPCQCYVIKKRVKSDRLICVDLICNGVQDRRILESEIRRLEVNAGAKITDYSMRYKKDHLHLPIYMHAKFENGIQYEEQLYKSALGKIYGARLALQRSCYNCKFKGISRLGDITIGDYRGFRVLGDKGINQCGASTIIVNTEIGNKLLDSIKGDLDLLQALSLHGVIFSNNRIVISGIRPSNKKIVRFWNLFNEKGIEESVGLTEKYLSRWGNIIRRILDRLLLIKHIIISRR